MRSVILLAAAGAASLLTTAATAADMRLAPPPPPAYYGPPPVEDFGGWYLRGDIGMSNQSVRSLDNALYYSPGISVENKGLGFDSAGIYGVGIGYKFNNWFRGDLTGEWRGKANFHGSDIVTFNGVAAGTDVYTASKSEWLALANVYADLGTWWCVTPFVGVGIGASRNTISGFTDLGPQSASLAFGDTTSKWNLAWAVHAGLAYQVAPGLTVELAYRYVDLGDALSGDLYTFDGTNNVYNPMEFKHITSHDVKLGVRWDLSAPPPPPPPPLVTKG
jgi:opacity protein-like surface antigen